MSRHGSTDDAHVTGSCSPEAGFRSRFERLCRDLIVPELRRVVIEHADTSPSPVLFHVEDHPGGTAPTADGSWGANRRVILATTPRMAELSLVAWDPYVIVLSRAGATVAQHHRLELITRTLVENIARRFMNEIPLHAVR